jgi:3-methyladenine DNA glycosylase Tag
MMSFEPILAAAIARIGEDELHRRLPEVKDAAALEALPDDRYLSLMSLRVFRAGLKHSVVDAKWPGFEDAFQGFALDSVRAMSDEDVETLMTDRRLIRHWGKLRSVRNNAAAMAEITVERGSFGHFLAAWPADRTVELWAELGRRFDQLGGESAPRFLRMAGRDTFILSPSVTAALQRWDVMEAPPKSKAERLKVQDIFNLWAAATGRKLAHLSMILASSVDD